ncbi:MAG: right-handed parallel beta-helix repeat-containing protein [Actinobacteria bacterium]|nr:right-handed parallel beta-helix repeat-containing protein [Actinomycetota bacterium]
MTQNVLRPRLTPRSATALLTSGSMLALGGGAGVLGAVLLASPAGAATFTVANTDNNGIGSLSQAIIDANAAAGADTIEFAPGVTGMINLITDLPDITDSLTIRGPGSAALTIAGNELYHAFTIATAGSGGVTISGLTVDSSDTRNTGEASGGAIAVTDTALTLDDVTLTNNQARPTSAQAFGGGLGVNNEPGTGDVVITNSVMTNNVAVSTPGGGPDGEPIGGGGAWITADNITVTNSTFSENQADVGAGIFALARESLTLTSLTVSNNNATDMGGGLVAGGSYVAISDSVVSGNQAPEGIVGGAYVASIGGPNAGTVSVTNTRISDNTSALVGGAFIAGFMEDFNTSLDRVTVTGNVATDPPDSSSLYSSVGGLLLFGSAEISNSTISNNTGTGMTLSSGSRITPVSTAGIQPMINVPSDSNVNISNTTISGNSAEGIVALTYTDGCGTVSTASSLSACASSLSPQTPEANLVELVLTHVLAADNGGEDIATPAFSLFSLIERPNAAVFAGYGTQLGVDPGLLALESVSDTVSVVPLSIGSAAWNAGWPGFTPPPATDQRGLPRVVDIIDIGAYEVQEAVLLPKFTG